MATETIGPSYGTYHQSYGTYQPYYDSYQPSYDYNAYDDSSDYGGTAGTTTAATAASLAVTIAGVELGALASANGAAAKLSPPHLPIG